VCAGGEGLVVERQRRHGAKPPDIPTRPREREREREGKRASAEA
jgi:hypothetical protein